MQTLYGTDSSCWKLFLTELWAFEKEIFLDKILQYYKHMNFKNYDQRNKFDLIFAEQNNLFCNFQEKKKAHVMWFAK